MSTDHPSDFAAQLELAWAAGFFDGEGCTFLANIAKGRFSYAGITIKQVVVENLERFRAAVDGLGRITGPYQEVTRCSPISKYQAVGTAARQVLRLLWPYLGSAKRQQAERALAAENNKGGVAAAKRTHCPKGHPYDEANTRTRASGRRCRACDAETQRRKRKTDKLHSSKRTHCPRGHDYLTNGFVNSQGRRVCRPCSTETRRRYAARLKALKGDS